MVVHPFSRERPEAEGTPAGTGWWTIDWGSHQRWLDVGGRHLNTIELGSPHGGAQAGEPALVFIHGLSGSWPNWLEQLCAFSSSHRVVAFDLPGFGHSPGHAGEVSMPGYARIVADALAKLGIARAVLVGNSMGGLISAELAAEEPELVEKLVLVSPAGVATYANRVATRSMPAVRRAQQLLALGAAWTASHSDSLAARRRLRRLVLSGVVAHPEQIPGPLAAEQLRGAGTDGFMSALEAILEFDLRPRLRLIRCPALVVWGKKDRLITWHDASRFTEEIPDAREVVYPDTGHMAMLERPREFNELLAGFIGAPA
jgi:pimeloyl-ACP methyl ester carboxylesterase